MSLADLLRTVEQGARDLATVEPDNDVTPEVVAQIQREADVYLVDDDWDALELEDGVLPDYPRIRDGADEWGKP